MQGLLFPDKIMLIWGTDPGISINACAGRLCGMAGEPVCPWGAGLCSCQSPQCVELGWLHSLSCQSHTSGCGCSYSPDSINIFTEIILFAGTVIDLILQGRKGEGLWRQKTLVWQKACWEVSSRRIRNPLNKCLLDMTLSPPV